MSFRSLLTVIFLIFSAIYLFSVDDKAGIDNEGLRHVFNGEAGDVAYIDKDGNELITYARKFDFKKRDKFVKELLKSISVEEYVQLGEEYQKEGGFFKVIERSVSEDFLRNNEYYLNAAYIFYYFIDNLRMSSVLDEEDMRFLLHLNTFSYFIGEYFESVDEPEEGDLVVYENCYGKINHMGIYKLGLDSGAEGVVESLVSAWGQGGIFQHDVFFLPGVADRAFVVAKFFRIKLECPYDVIVELWEKKKDGFKGMYKIDENGTYTFNETEDNKLLRKKISSLYGKDLLKEFPEIQSLRHINASGVCINYAVQRTLKAILNNIRPVGYGGFDKMLDEYFIPQTAPENGDLVVYYQSLESEPVHYGVYYADEIVESKWGNGDVYRHPIFYVDNRYGKFVRFFKPKEKFFEPF